jgi:hypothetical protein
MKKLIKIGSIVCLFAIFGGLFNGCATLFKGNSSKIDLSSDPSSANVYVNGNLMGKTPVKLKLESKLTYHIEFKKEGYETKTYTITNSVGGGWVVLDIFLTGFLGVIVDAATGAWYELDQNHVNAILEKQK